jgi:hypothetical protein
MRDKSAYFPAWPVNRSRDEIALLVLIVPLWLMTAIVLLLVLTRSG